MSLVLVLDVTLGPELLSSLGRPRAWQRGTPYQGRVITPREQRAYQARVAAMCWEDRARRTGAMRPITGAIEVSVEAFYRRPKSGPHKKAAACLVKPDVDNVAKTILDALQKQAPAMGRLIEDDAQVVRLTAGKRWADPGRERVEVRVWEVQGG